MPDAQALFAPPPPHPPRILLLYGSAGSRAYSRLLTLEAAALLERLGAQVRIFEPLGLPLPDDAAADHPRVAELRAMSAWSEGQVWCSPESNGAMTAILKAQIDWLPLPLAPGAPALTQGKTLALMQISGGTRSFNAVDQMRILGQRMRMIAIPSQCSVAEAYNAFEDEGHMKPSPAYDDVVDLMEELVKFTLLTRSASASLTEHYSARKDALAEKPPAPR
ncbi:arsenical resistance protein ArsH [Roseixanthobacter glucoisosaccharinicivorans]|uniref:arsenical resistance protein ArsH n=1 Tax=Roseixanthobacter glucoisosaccharinicivorans TaxID=3119923 RepID=UPI00372844F3